MGQTVRYKRATERKRIAVDFSDKLDLEEILSGTPLAGEYGTNALHIYDVEFSSVERIISGKVVDIGKAVEFNVSGGVKGTTYKIRVTVETDTSPTQGLTKDITLRVN